MWKFKHLFMNAEPGAAGAPAGGENDPGTGGDSNLGAGSVLSSGAQPGANDWLPEKYRVSGEDGALNVEQSARKLAEAHVALEKRMGGVGTAPKTADEYSPAVEVDGFKWDEFKAAPETQSFLKAAHAKGITNDQMGFILGEYVKNAQQIATGSAELDAEAATTALRETWKTDSEFKQNIGLAYRAFNSLAEQGDDINVIGNNPMVIRMLAKIGAEMQEDAPAGGEINPSEQQSIRELMKSPAYMDSKHADHERVSAQVRAFYQKSYGDQTVA
ncbi:hypothetical protein [Cedecea sp. NFIX57]|uniref:hypothetical protein n=1 Tax=Cedecea sp. NFIX57 TaxID=1566286 RepID=UPI000A0BAFDC|nr:hypothetical protein [Cedecea sp. NFIX57]SMG60167.1 hypothetical protein SAMN03159353_103413 [Cedecea sp. NFIX57]